MCSSAKRFPAVAGRGGVVILLLRAYGTGRRWRCGRPGRATEPWPSPGIRLLLRPVLTRYLDDGGLPLPIVQKQVGHPLIPLASEETRACLERRILWLSAFAWAA